MYMIIDSFISSPIEFPKIIPSDWDRWWNLWEKEADPAIKLMKTHNTTSANWIGMNVYVKEGIDSVAYSGYKIKTINCPELFPALFDNIDKFPFDISIMQVVSSQCPISPHTDNTNPKISIRSMLATTNFTPTFYYLVDGVKKYQTLPETTNTWVYHDNKGKHGSDYYYGHSKHLIIYHGNVKREILEQNILSCHHQYDSYIIRDDNAVPSTT